MTTRRPIGHMIVSALTLPLVALASVSCSPDSAARATSLSPRVAGYYGEALPAPVEMPAATLVDMNGRPFDLRRETAGVVTLILFGYTNCPDICPVHLANLSAVLGEAGDIPRERLKVLFITTDPERDTPERLREWMSHFDPSFIGLTGSEAAIRRLQSQLRLPAAVKQQPRADGEYTVGHAAQVLVFTRDNRAHLAYPFGTRQEEWAQDLPRLVREDWSGGAAAR